MAQAKMGELDKLVRNIYHQFPPETLEPTRKLLGGKDPYGLFAHIESLLATRQLDEVLAKNETFRLLASDIYGARHPWLRDADLGATQWCAFQEHAAETLRTQARQAAAKEDPEAAAKRKRELMLRKIREDGPDVHRWRKVLGFEGVVFSDAEVKAAKESSSSGGMSARAEHAFGRDVDMEVTEGVDVTACLDGPKGTYGPSLYVGPAEEVVLEVPAQLMPPPIPKAPAEGGEAPRNPFTTEWWAREAPETEASSFDPYFTSNQYIRRTNKYELPRLSYPPKNQTEDTEATVPSSSTVPSEEDQARPPDPTGMAAQRTAVVQPTPTKARIGNVVSGGTAPIRLTGTETMTEPTTTKVPRSITSTKPREEVTVIQPQTTQPSISITNPTPTEPTAPITHSPGLTTILELPEPSSTSPALVRPSPAPPSEEPIKTPRGEPMDPSPPSSPLRPRDEDSEMLDIDPSASETEQDARGRPHSDGWLVNWLRRRRADAAAAVSVDDDDLQMMSYRGWRIHSPKVQLIRIKNFLADEDIDRTLDWERKFAEVSLFLQHCLRLPKAARRSWYPDLCECVSMLHTHWVFEQHHYGEKKLVVDFPRLSGVSTRLPTLRDGRDIVVEKAPGKDDEEAVRPRYLVHRVPESVQDVDYQLPGGLLREMFLTWFREDANLVWGTHPDSTEVIGSGWRQSKFKYKPDFNMAVTEDRRFGACTNGGAEATAADLKGDANFYFLMNEFVAGETEMIEGSKGRMRRVQKHYPSGEALQRFARYRGAKRAALQLCLSHFNSVENVAIQGPFKKLVLPPTRRAREMTRSEARVDVVYKPRAIEEPPEGVKLDPLGLTYWFSSMRESYIDRAQWARDIVETGRREQLQQLGQRSEEMVLLPRNYQGPVTGFSLLNDQERRAVQRHKLLSAMRDRLKRAQARAPRQMLEGVLRNIELGYQGNQSWDMKEELKAHMERYGEYREVDDMELHWLGFVCGPSTNVKAQLEELPKLGREFDVFVARVQKLLDDPDSESILAKQERKVDLRDLTTALNTGLREGDFVLEEEKVGTYCKALSDHGRLEYEASPSGTVLVGRPICDWHPEHRINWPEGPDAWDANTNPWHAANLPPPSDTWSWPTAFANLAFVDASRLLTKRMLWSRAWRLGAELSSLATKLSSSANMLADELGDRALALQDVCGSWEHRFNMRVSPPGPPVSYVSVVKAGDPGKWHRGMKEEEEAYEIVRQGVIDELSEGASTLWPARPRFTYVRCSSDSSSSGSGSGSGEAGPGSSTEDKDSGDETVPVMTKHRERVWDWARPGVCGLKKKFFSVNRWPVHLQTEQTQERIRNSLNYDLAQREGQKAAEKAALEEIAARSRPSAAEAARWQMERMLSVPYHEGSDDTRQFVPGQTEYWAGDTPSQKQAIEGLVKKTIADFNNDSAPRPPRKSWFGTPPSAPREDDERGVMLPEVRSPDVPRSVPSPFARGTASEETPQPTARAKVIRPKKPKFPITYPPGQEEAFRQTEEYQRRVRFQEEEDDDGIR